MRYALKDLTIDMEARAIRRGNCPLKLSDLSFDVFAKLLEVAPEPLNLSDISAEVWNTEFVSDETIAQRIALLRKALGDDPKNPIYIRTVRGKGYAIMGPVSRIEHTAAPLQSLPFSPRKAAAGIAAAAIALSLTIVAITQDHGTDATPAALASEPAPKSAAAPMIKRASEQLGMRQARETDRAIAMLREALTLDPQNVDGRLTLSFALSTKTTKFGGTKSQKQEAEALARDLIHEQPENSNAWSALGYALGSQGRLDESLSAYQYAYQLNPNNTSAISSAAHSYLVRGDLHRALTLEVRARLRGGTSRYAEVQVAQSLELIGHPAANDWYERAISLNPVQAVVLGEVARSHLRQGNPAAALEFLGRVENDDHFVPHIMQLRGRAALALGLHEEARQYLEAAGESGLIDIAALDALSGDETQANALLHPAKLATLEGDSWPPTRVQLAELAAALGDNERATRFLTQAVNLGWRDIQWLARSPFLGSFMASGAGQEIEARIGQDLEVQRMLIEANKELTPIFSP